MEVLKHPMGIAIVAIINRKRIGMNKQKFAENAKQKILKKIAEKIYSVNTDEVSGASHSSGSVRSTHSNSNRVGTKSHNSSSHGAIRRH